jgi:uncharacterized membrane protein YhaH (DUF805 family)
MNSKPTNKFNRKDYLFLTVCLIIFFTVIMYIMGYGTFPKGYELITTIIAVLIAIPIVLYVLKKLNDEQE